MFGIFFFHMQSMVSSLEQKIDETEKKFKEKVKQALEAEDKIVNLKTAMHKYSFTIGLLAIEFPFTEILRSFFFICRLQETLEDVINENHVLKQSALSTPVKTASGRFFPYTPVKVNISGEIFEMTKSDSLSINHPNQQHCSYSRRTCKMPKKINSL